MTKYTIKRIATDLLIVSLFILLPSISFANNIKYNIGVSYLYANINDKNYDYVDKYESAESLKDQSFNIGASTFFKNNINVSLSTNRLLENPVRRAVIRKKDKLQFLNKTKTTIDSISIGYKIKRFNPSIVLANVKMQKSLYYKDNLVGKSSNATILGGVNLGYFITKNIIASTSYILPNQELDLESAFVINLNYLF